MTFAAAPYDAPTIGLMAAALQTAWMAAQLGVPGMSPDDHAKMEAAILTAAARGERGFGQLQQAALDALGTTEVKPVERRQRLRLVE